MKFSALVLICAATGLAFAQNPAAPAPAAAPAAAPTPAPAALPLSSYPEVHADRRVTFRIAAPKAADVSLISDWTGAQKMAKGADGVWTLTVGPMAPSSYIYSFNVDGTPMADPINPRVKLRARTSGSYFEVPAGASPAMDEIRDVPHGSVDMNWHKATAIDGGTRSVWVYTPPGYAQQSAQRYPVFYLFHGNNDRPNGWTDIGNVHLILDNLIAEKKIEPMLVVMPYGHALPFGQRGGGAGGRNNTTVFTDYLLKDVIPLVEGKYRVATGRENRALGGFSMGAEQSLHIFFHHLDLFSSLGALAPSGYRVLEERHAALLADAAGTNTKIKVLWIGCGRQDPGHFSGSQQLAEKLTAHGIMHTWKPVEGAHNHAFIRGQLLEFLPLLFRPGK